MHSYSLSNHKLADLFVSIYYRTKYNVRLDQKTIYGV